MRVVFMGTPEFAVPALVATAQSHSVVAVFTRADAVSGRGSTTKPSPVKVAAQAAGIPVFQPSTLTDPLVQQHIASAAPDVVVVAAYGLLLPREILVIPHLGCINVHASLLPRWRGAAPIHRAVLAGDAETGVSIMRMEEGLDTGPYCIVDRTPIDEKAVPELTDELAALGARALLAALEALEDGTCDWVAQDDQLATYAEKIDKSEVALSPGLRVVDALRRVRASTRQAPSRAVIAGRMVTVLVANKSEAQLSPGATLASKKGLVLGFSDGSLEITLLKPSGKAEMSAADWARGVRLSGAEPWGTPS